MQAGKNAQLQRYGLLKSEPYGIELTKFFRRLFEQAEFKITLGTRRRRMACRSSGLTDLIMIPRMIS